MNIYTTLSDVLENFDPISLKEIDEFKLMDRTETKFVFQIQFLPALLEQLFNHYFILEVTDVKINRYETLYLDTEDFQLYLWHQNGKLNRHKIRFRNYIETGLNFFEIKFKNNKGRTIKSRIIRKDREYRIEGEAKHLILEKTSLDPGSLFPKLWVNYSRITLVNKFSKERLTIDINLNFKNNVSDKRFDKIVIAEVKQERSYSSPFLKLMKEKHIHEGSISKYCLGVISLYEQVKKNNFKPRLLKLERMIS